VNYLIDTNIISEIRKGLRCDRHVASWYASIADQDIFLSVLVLGEIRKGLERLRLKEPARAGALESWLLNISETFADRILPVDRAVADEWGRMSAIRPAPPVDGLLAATAKVHGMTLATRNTADVDGLGAEVVNPFDPS
jgi:predicted nucleic acid-binding protein